MTTKINISQNTAKSTGKFSFPLLATMFIVGALLLVFTEYKELGETLIWIVVWITGILIAVVVSFMIIISAIIGLAMRDG